MAHWLGSLFNIVFWIFLFIILCLVTIYCINISKVDSFERNATPQIQRISDPTGNNSQTSADAIDKIQELNHAYIDDGMPLYKVLGTYKVKDTKDNGTHDESNNTVDNQNNTTKITSITEYEYTKNGHWQLVPSGQFINYGTPVMYQVQSDIPYIIMPGITVGHSVHTMKVVTTCQANHDDATNDPEEKDNNGSPIKETVNNKVQIKRDNQ